MIYTGIRKATSVVVSVAADDYKTQNILPMRLDLANHSPTGFEWGYEGSGPAQLALAILAYEYDKDIAIKYYQDFKKLAIATIDINYWVMNSSFIKETIDEINATHKKGAIDKGEG